MALKKVKLYLKKCFLTAADGSCPELHQSFAAMKQGEWLLFGSHWAPLTTPYLPAVPECEVGMLPAESEHVINESGT